MAFDKSVPSTFAKSGIYYFERRVPSDLRKHYSTSKISYSLRTWSPAVAKSRSIRAAQQLEEHWYYLRIQNFKLPAKYLLRLVQNGSVVNVGASAAVSETADVKLSDAVAIYLKRKWQGRPVTFHRAAGRACGYVIDACSEKSITAYRKADANAFRDDLIGRGLAGSSITRVFGPVRSVVNFAASEIGIDLPNVFGKAY